MRWWHFLLGLGGSGAIGRWASVGGVNGDWLLQGGEREVAGQRRFNGETKGGDSMLQFNSFQAREGDHWQRATQRRTSRTTETRGKSWRKETVRLG
jgi:hypothetical protein